jgi:transposase, IS5 family
MQAVIDVGYIGVDANNPDVKIPRCGHWQSMAAQQRRWVDGRQANEPTVGLLKAVQRTYRCRLRGATGYALRVVLCAAGFNLRLLLRPNVLPGISAVLLGLVAWWRNPGNRRIERLARADDTRLPVCLRSSAQPRRLCGVGWLSAGGFRRAD